MLYLLDVCSDEGSIVGGSGSLVVLKPVSMDAGPASIRELLEPAQAELYVPPSLAWFTVSRFRASSWRMKTISSGIASTLKREAAEQGGDYRLI